MEQQPIVDSYEQIVEVICAINEFHLRMSKEQESYLTLNLKKNTVSSIISDEGISQQFQSIIDRYRRALLTVNMLELINFSSNFPYVRFRIKQAESISEKLLYYSTKEGNNGEYPINKCLNDILGFRIIVSNSPEINSLLQSDTAIQNTVFKIIQRKIGDYEATHLYFKNKKNSYFPWELQIWDVSHSSLNVESHEKHKQKRKYISLPWDYHKANLEKEE